MLTDERLEEIRKKSVAETTGEFSQAWALTEGDRVDLVCEIDRLKGEVIELLAETDVLGADIEDKEAQLAEAKRLISEYRALIAIDSDWFTTNEANYYDGQDNQAEAWLKEVEE